MDIESLLAENASLKEQNRSLQEALNLLQIQNRKLEAKIEEQNILIEKLQQQLHDLFRKLYGKKSEKMKPEQSSPDEPKSQEEPAKEDSETTSKNAPVRNGCRNLPPELPRETTTYDLPDDKKNVHHAKASCT